MALPSDMESASPCSQLEIVLRVTPISAAASSWVLPERTLAARMLLTHSAVAFIITPYCYSESE